MSGIRSVAALLSTLLLISCTGTVAQPPVSPILVNGATQIQLEVQSRTARPTSQPVRETAPTRSATPAAPRTIQAASTTPHIHIARNYNTTTLLVGLHADSDLNAAKALTSRLNLEVER